MDYSHLGLALIGTLATLFGAAHLRSRTLAPVRPRLVENRLLFLIRNDSVVDTNFTAQQLLKRISSDLSSMDGLRSFLASNFDDSEQLLQSGKNGESLAKQSRDGTIQATRAQAGDTIRLKISFATAEPPVDGDMHTLRALETELTMLRANTDAAPFLLWRQSPNGEVTWVNQAYLARAEGAVGYERGLWPLPILFPQLRNLKAIKGTETRRLSIAGAEGGDESWYDCHICPVGTEILCTAIPADEAVRSEHRRREFTQTLTKTFAELAIGLAIFDRSRRLVLFNPALLDLTNLPTDFLASRPSLVGFLDRLRENRVMPEPRDYRSWRNAISELEAAAVDGTYSDTWSLPDGQTYHVTGRPHPDGAVALLFEDISAEMSLTRHFRAELARSQSVLDAMDDAVVVFSPNGEIALMNKAYKELWNIQDIENQAWDLAQSTRVWHELCTPTPVWGDFREFAGSDEDREEWTAGVAMRDGRRMFCRFLPQKGGGTLAIFRLDTVEEGSLFQDVG